MLELYYIYFMYIFVDKVIELLGHAPQCSILFHQFIPAYHHHYGHQCRVADFGFTKLIELFEAIPDIVKVTIINELICLW